MTKLRTLFCVVSVATLAAVLAPTVYGGSPPPPPPCDPVKDPNCPPPPPPSGPKCETKKGTVFLDQDPANVNNSDRKVTFCHATSSATNPFVVITTSINACRAHETHTKQPKGGERDVFPTGGCQD